MRTNILHSWIDKDGKFPLITERTHTHTYARARHLPDPEKNSDAAFMTFDSRGMAHSVSASAEIGAAVCCAWLMNCGSSGVGGGLLMECGHMSEIEYESRSSMVMRMWRPVYVSAFACM